MKIVFVCGCLEQGKDGVGDYTRKLASSCKNFGAEVFLISLNDQYVGKPTENTQPFFSLRLLYSNKWQDKEKKIRNEIELIHPDYISIQFVPYAFHPKGFVTNTSFFEKICKGYRVHIMFHELWISEELGGSLIRRLTGKIQKRGILRLIKILKPIQVHTSNALYKKILAYYKVSSTVLSLFGNISIIRQPDFNWIIKEITARTNEPINVNNQDYVIGGVFGTIHPSWDLSPVLKWLEKCRLSGNKIILISIGKAGAAAGMWDQFAKQYPAYQFLVLGERSEEKISSFMQFIDFGIASTPYILLDKSGAFITMKEHGLPVLCQNPVVKFRFNYREENSYKGLTIVDKQVFWSKIPQRERINPLLQETTKQFLADLKGIKTD